MFPLDPQIFIPFVLIGIALFSALALQFGWRWRVPLLVLAVALPVGFFWFEPLTGDYAGLMYIFIVGLSLIMITLGAAWGLIMRLVRVSPLMSVAAPIIAAGVCVSFLLWQQYIPSACLEAPLKIRIAGQTLHLPPQLRPRLERGDTIRRFGQIDKKSDYAGFCKIGRNGTRTIEMDTVWISPVSTHKAMTSVCNANAPPAWCRSYSPELYRHIRRILITPATVTPIPMYWKQGGSPKRDRQGDLTRGSVCLLPNAESKTQCWIWQPFGTGSRLTISTYSQDPIFTDMPVEDARDMIRQARDTMLAIIVQ